jgi:uncharacterized protein (DUF58 family)
MSSSALHIGKFNFGRRFDRWVLERVRSRRGTAQLPLTFEYRHIYVMPTMFGFWFGVLLFLMALGALNFNNNTALMLGFLLASIAQMTTLLAYRNLVGMTLVGVRAQPVFAGRPARFRVLLENPERRVRFAIQAVSAESADCWDIAENHSGHLELKQDTSKRGWMVMKPFRIENRFPLGLFRAWSVIIPDARCLVYPQPHPVRLLCREPAVAIPVRRKGGKANIYTACVSTSPETRCAGWRGGPAHAIKSFIPGRWKRPARNPVNSTGT